MKHLQETRPSLQLQHKHVWMCESLKDKQTKKQTNTSCFITASLINSSGNPWLWNYCQADSFRDKEFISFKTLIYFLSKASHLTGVILNLSAGWQNKIIWQVFCPQINLC